MGPESASMWMRARLSTIGLIGIMLILLNVCAPLVSQMLQTRGSADRVAQELCVADPAAGSTPLPDDTQPSPPHQLMHPVCGYCVIQAHLVLLPPPQGSSQRVHAALPHHQPARWQLEPDLPCPGWLSTAPPRAPPRV